MDSKLELFSVQPLIAQLLPARTASLILDRSSPGYAAKGKGDDWKFLIFADCELESLLTDVAGSTAEG